MNKQLSLSFVQDELATVLTNKKAFLALTEDTIPWDEWEAIVRPHYYAGERGNKRIHICRCRLLMMHQTIISVHADVRLVTEKPAVPLLRLVRVGVTLPAAIAKQKEINKIPGTNQAQRAGEIIDSGESGAHFWDIKDSVQISKNAARGLAKQNATLHLRFALANLYIAATRYAAA